MLSPWRIYTQTRACRHIRSLVTDLPSCYIMVFLGEVKPFLLSGDMGELEEGEESKGK